MAFENGVVPEYWRSLVIFPLYKSENGDEKEVSEWRLPGLLYADDLVMCGESKEDLRAMVGLFVEVCRRRGLKVNTGKSKVMILNGEVYVDGIRLEHVTEFKYLFKYVLWTNQVQMGQSVVGRWHVVGGLRVPLGH